MKTIRRLLPMLLACALLAACGNKGDLVRPEPAAVTPSSIGAAEG
jgi:predicted small lipoprotein YifL